MASTGMIRNEKLVLTTLSARLEVSGFVEVLAHFVLHDEDNLGVFEERFGG